MSLFGNDQPVPRGSKVVEHLDGHDREGVVRNGTLNSLDWVPSNPGTLRAYTFCLGCWNVTLTTRGNQRELQLRRLAPDPKHLHPNHRPEANSYTITMPL